MHTRLAELAAAVEAHADEVHDLDSCRRTLDRIGESVNSPAPDRGLLAERLEMLGLAIGSAAALITIADGLQAAIGVAFA